MSDDLLEIFDEDNKKEVATTSTEVVVKTDADEDLEYTRDKLKELIDTTSPVLEHASDIALEGGEPRQIEVVSGLAKSIADITKSILEAGKLKKEIDQKAGIDLNPPGQINQTNNTIFVGSTKDLLEQLEKDEEVIEVEAQEVEESKT